MQVINLSKKKIINIKINNKDCEMSMDTLAIDHFQRTNKIGLSKALELMKKENTNIVYKLICSFIREKKTRQILGHDYFKQFDDFQIIQNLQPALLELFEDMPAAKNETEKK
ncbi:hypothetical protein [Clostridium celatum]|uniref:hypothetical protein n=1 Tax=Clostridium celatum TaxID=36834 RepID=UPI0028FFF669|nr:hypothetical protein [Clostridium celatum]MDU2266694.1 hypothetical protein [Clostridium celatum]MDU6297061.1 hypothetical protein [Clostridium celatum]